MLVDGFAGSEWSLYVNGKQVKARPERSQVDAQMKAVDITTVPAQGRKPDRTAPGCDECDRWLARPVEINR